MKKIHLDKSGESVRVLQIAPADSIHRWLLRYHMFELYDTTDLYMEDVTFKSDIQDLKEIADKTYDLIICSHVLEHVQDDMKALRAMKRVLKDDGQIVFLVPIDLNRNEIDEEWGCSEEENWRRFGRGDHCRAYSRNGLIERLREVFCVHALGKEYFGEDCFKACGLLDTSMLYVLTKDKGVSLDKEYVPYIDKELCENGPLVSVVMSAYNHEAFVGAAIESVIGQSYKNIEFIVADDGSSDNTADVMRQYSNYFAFEMYYKENIGGRCAKLGQYAHGKYIALMNSDDLWEKDKLAIQVSYMEKHPECGVCLSWCEYTDADMNILADRTFIRKNRSRTEWMSFFWKNGNALCNPSSLARPEYYNDHQYGAYARQLPDFFRWIDIVQKTEIHIVPKTLIYMRRYAEPGKENSSAVNGQNIFRGEMEAGINWMFMIRDMDDDFFLEAFRDCLINKHPETKEEVLAEKFLLLIRSGNDFKEYSAFYYFYENHNSIQTVLSEKYGYTCLDFWKDELQKGMGKHFKEI